MRRRSFLQALVTLALPAAPAPKGLLGAAPVGVVTGVCHQTGVVTVSMGDICKLFARLANEAEKLKLKAGTRRNWR